MPISSSASGVVTSLLNQPNSQELNLYQQQQQTQQLQQHIHEHLPIVEPALLLSHFTEFNLCDSLKSQAQINHFNHYNNNSSTRTSRTSSRNNFNKDIMVRITASSTAIGPSCSVQYVPFYEQRQSLPFALPAIYLTSHNHNSQQTLPATNHFGGSLTANNYSPYSYKVLLLFYLFAVISSVLQCVKNSLLFLFSLILQYFFRKFLLSFLFHL